MTALGPPPPSSAAETKASHEVMDMVRQSSALSHLVIRLRQAGKSWREVKDAIDAEIKRASPGRD